jgi:hypothetical protein
MSNIQPKHIPFTTKEEMIFHIEMSYILTEKIKTRIKQLGSADESNGRIENYITDSLKVLVDGYVNMVLSIEQGYIQ